ncbi:MAG: hypothetical protein DMF78_07230 [Acidobacteria bacterium]|nr:MAG: hypothetical protein DMF78_07230 [Acidobacteriota bacterium]
MGKLSDLVNKGVRLIVVDHDASGSSGGSAPSPPPPPPREIQPGEIEAPTPAPVRSDVAMEVEDFGAVYDEAGVAIPDHGYGVDKVAEMLQGKRLSALGREVRATAVLAALEAAQVDVTDVIADAVKRDKALDAFEAAKERELHELRTKNEGGGAAARGGRELRGALPEPHHRRIAPGLYTAETRRVRTSRPVSAALRSSGARRGVSGGEPTAIGMIGSVPPLRLKTN